MARNKTDGNLKDWQHLVRVVALAGGALGTLALGAVLHVDTPHGGESIAQTPNRDSDYAWAERDDSAPPSPETTTPDRPAELSQQPVELPTEPRSEPRAADVGAPSSSPAPPSDRTLSMRVSESARLVDDSSGWTLQFMLTCDDAKAQRVLQELGGDPRLHLLPTVHNDRSCLRICWNQYSSHDEAVADRDLPAALLALAPKPMPRKLTDLAP